MSSPIFADRIVNLAVTGPLVRLELGTLQAPRNKHEKPQLVPSGTLVMPLDGFAASVGMMDAMLKQLVKDGVLKPNPAPASDLIDTTIRQ